MIPAVEPICLLSQYLKNAGAAIETGEHAPMMRQQYVFNRSIAHSKGILNHAHL